MNKAEKINIRELENTPDYDPFSWMNLKEAGCYPYALNLKTNKFFLVGDLIGKRCNSIVSDKILIETMKEELKSIFDYEVIEVDTDELVARNEKKIYLQRDDHTGYYHFLRQDSDGFWSHKFPNELPERKDSYGQVIRDPDAMVESSFKGWCFLLRRKELALC